MAACRRDGRGLHRRRIGRARLCGGMVHRRKDRRQAARDEPRHRPVEVLDHEVLNPTRISMVGV